VCLSLFADDLSDEGRVFGGDGGDGGDLKAEQGKKFEEISHLTQSELKFFTLANQHP
jgi:GTPase involved in cell partitioning and DNA repair